MKDVNEIRRIVIENVMTLQEAADYLGMTRAGVWKAVKGGALKRLPNELYFKPDLDVYRQTVKIGRPPKETANFPGKTNS